MITRILTLGLLVGALSSCQKDAFEDMTQEESRIYITQQAPGTNFKNYQTFSIADSVVVVDGNNTHWEPATAEAGFIEAFKSQMQSRGYVYVDRSQNPDLGLQVSRILQTNSGVVWQDYYDYWGAGYWGGGYGWGADPGWWSMPVYYETTEGMLSFDVVDVKSAAASNQLNIIWNGLIRGSGIYTPAEMSSQVLQLFSQSPYLTNK